MGGGIYDVLAHTYSMDCPIWQHNSCMYLSCKNSLPLHILSPHLAFNSLITKYGSLGWMLNAYRVGGGGGGGTYSGLQNIRVLWRLENPCAGL
jgi:hypothetical protein